MKPIQAIEQCEPLTSLRSQASGDLKKLKNLKRWTRLGLTTLVILALVLGTPVALPTFANYLDTLSDDSVKTEEELQAEKEARFQQLVWGILALTLVGGVATFKSLHRMESVEESDVFFSGDDLTEEDEDDDEFMEELTELSLDNEEKNTPNE